MAANYALCKLCPICVDGKCEMNSWDDVPPERRSDCPTFVEHEEYCDEVEKKLVEACR